jgi:tRNA pseudouridine65 synthase
MLDILFEDDFLVGINKPHDLLVHRSSIARDVSEFALQKLRDQLHIWVSPVHRLDRKTSGVLLFAKQKDAEIAMQKQFAEGLVRKAYLAIVRGHTPDEQAIDYPLKKENGNLQEAYTHFKTLFRTELPIPLGQHPTSRYSLVEAKPTTGRMHQLRKHFSHIFHPIIGDTAHGCNKQNRMFKAQWNSNTMYLHASALNFKHPVNEQPITILAPLQPQFIKMMTIMGWPAEPHDF